MGNTDTKPRQPSEDTFKAELNDGDAWHCGAVKRSLPLAERRLVDSAFSISDDANKVQ